MIFSVNRRYLKVVAADTAIATDAADATADAEIEYVAVASVSGVVASEAFKNAFAFIQLHLSP